jgi:hypothetical protein
LLTDRVAGQSGSQIRAGFSAAKLYLGESYAEVEKANPGIRESSDQEQQVQLLFVGRTEAILPAINIFRHYAQKLPESVTREPVQIHRHFPGDPVKSRIQA